DEWGDELAPGSLRTCADSSKPCRAPCYTRFLFLFFLFWTRDGTIRVGGEALPGCPGHPGRGACERPSGSAVRPGEGTQGVTWMLRNTGWGLAVLSAALLGMAPLARAGDKALSKESFVFGTLTAPTEASVRREAANWLREQGKLDRQAF